jgi:hypothetical protein
VSDEQWVIVTFGGSDEIMPVTWMDALLPTEMAAIEALETAEAGYIDGNDVGQYEYQLYFVGEDRHVVWDTIEPVFAAAPIRWTRVELRRDFEDSEPEVLLPE